MAEALRHYWTPNFQPLRCNQRLGQAMARVFVAPCGPQCWPPHSPGLVDAIMNRARSSTPGPDGLPHRAWAAACEEAWKGIADLIAAIARGDRPPQTLNRSLGVLLLKGRCAHDPKDSGQRTRHAAGTRPLTLKHSDARCIASMVARPVDVALRREAPHAQQGFIGDRSTLVNIVALESAARIATLATRDASWLRLRSRSPLPSRTAEPQPKSHRRPPPPTHPRRLPATTPSAPPAALARPPARAAAYRAEHADAVARPHHRRHEPHR